MSRPTYVYDTRTQMTEPIIVVYDDAQVNRCIAAICGCLIGSSDQFIKPDWVLITKVRMHKTSANERYLDLPPTKKRTW